MIVIIVILYYKYQIKLFLLLHSKKHIPNLHVISEERQQYIFIYQYTMSDN